MNLTIWCGWVGFSRSHPQNFPFLLASRGYFQNFHTSSQTYITDIFVNYNVLWVLCYHTYRNLWRCSLLIVGTKEQVDNKTWLVYSVHFKENGSYQIKSSLHFLEYNSYLCYLFSTKRWRKWWSINNWKNRGFHICVTP